MTRAPRARGAAPVAIILGTRPEIIKLAPLLRALEAGGAPTLLVHTGQHYSESLDAVFFRDLQLRPPDHHLGVGSKPAGQQTGEMLANLEPVLEAADPACVVYEGDTNSVLAAALAAIKLHRPGVHVEAGLRSGDRSMPEEMNRILADHAAELLLAPTSGARANLLREGLPAQRIQVTGNTVVDAVQQHLPLALARRAPAAVARAEPFAVATVHRVENVESRERFAGILEGFRRFATETGMRVVYPIHPHSRRTMGAFGLSARGLDVVEPMGYLDFLRLEAEASLIFTDSGGVQEEACILRVPCVTVRDNTERPETLEVGANELAGTRPNRILAAARRALRAKRTWPNPFGDGHAADRTAEALVRRGWAHPTVRAPTTRRPRSRAR